MELRARYFQGMLATIRLEIRRVDAAYGAGRTTRCGVVRTVPVHMQLPVNFFFHGATTPSGPGLPHYRGFTITLRHTTLFWTSDQSEAETST